MEALDRLSYHMARLAVWLSAVILVYMVGHILVEIVLRVFFSKSTYVLDEFVAYATAAITFLCLAYSIRENALIRVEMLLHHLFGRTRQVFEIIGVTVTLVIMAILTWFFWEKTLWRDILRGTTSESIAEIPLWIPESFVMVGLVLFVFQLLTMLLRLLFGGASKARVDGGR